MITNWMLVAVNALIIVGTIAYAEQDPNEDEDPEDPGEGQIISKRIFSNTYMPFGYGSVLELFRMTNI